MRVIPFMRQGRHERPSTKGGNTCTRSRSSGTSDEFRSGYVCALSSVHVRRFSSAVRDASSVCRAASSSTGWASYRDEMSVVNNLG